MKFDEYTNKLKELNDKIAAANEKLAKAESEDDTNAAVAELSDLNGQVATLKDTFIQEQHDNYIELNNKYNKSEQERVQALQIASAKANEQPKIERDPRKIFKSGMGGN